MNSAISTFGEHIPEAKFKDNFDVLLEVGFCNDRGEESCSGSEEDEHSGAVDWI